MIGDSDFGLDCPQRYWLGVIAEAWQVPGHRDAVIAPTASAGLGHTLVTHLA
jgi:hypothetical protein